jgi:hypothetical protein
MIVVFGGEDKKPIKNDVDSEVIVPVTNETAEVKTGTSHDFKKLIAEPKLDAWVEANPWFHSEKEMRVFALEIHEKLVSEGADGPPFFKYLCSRRGCLRLSQEYLKTYLSFIYSSIEKTISIPLVVFLTQADTLCLVAELI